MRINLRGKAEQLLIDYCERTGFSPTETVAHLINQLEFLESLNQLDDVPDTQENRDDLQKPIRDY